MLDNKKILQWLDVLRWDKNTSLLRKLAGRCAGRLSGRKKCSNKKSTCIWDDRSLKKIVKTTPVQEFGCRNDMLSHLYLMTNGCNFG